MAQSMTSENIKYFKELIAEVEPYPLDVLDKIGFDNDGYDELRVLSTMAKKRLLDCGILIEDEQPRSGSESGTA